MRKLVVILFAGATLGLFASPASARPTVDGCTADKCSPPPPPSRCTPATPDACDKAPTPPRCTFGVVSDLCGSPDKAAPVRHYCVGPARRDCSTPPDPRLR